MSYDDEYQRRMSSSNDGDAINQGEVSSLIPSPPRRWYYYSTPKKAICIVVGVGLLISFLICFAAAMTSSLSTHIVSTSMVDINLLNTISPVTSNNDTVRVSKSSQLIVKRGSNNPLEYTVYSGSCSPNIEHLYFQLPRHIPLSANYWNTIADYKWLGNETSLMINFDVLCGDSNNCTSSSIVLLVINQSHYQTLECKYGICFSKQLDSNNTVSFNVSHLPPGYYFIKVQLNGMSNVMAQWAVNGTYGNYTLDSGSYTEQCHIPSYNTQDECIANNFTLGECAFIVTRTSDSTASPKFYPYKMTLLSPTKQLNVLSFVFIGLVSIFFPSLIVYLVIGGCFACGRCKSPQQSTSL